MFMRFLGEQKRIRENRMSDDIITFMLGYVIASFLLSALFVRLGKQTALAKKIREHFYWFPLIPPALAVWIIFQGMIAAIRSLLGFLRFCFESLSGHKTYRRKKIEPYCSYHD